MDRGASTIQRIRNRGNVLTATTHRVIATDSLASIAQQYDGEQRLWTLIYEANRSLIGENPNRISVGTELVIPRRPGAESAD